MGAKKRQLSLGQRLLRAGSFIPLLLPQPGSELSEHGTELQVTYGQETAGAGAQPVEWPLRYPVLNHPVAGGQQGRARWLGSHRDGHLPLLHRPTGGQKENHFQCSLASDLVLSLFE